MGRKIVTLIRPPVISSVSSFSVPITPPLALAYLTAALEARGIAVDPIDAIGEDIGHIELMSRRRKAQGLSFDRIVERVDPETDIIGISVMFSQEWPLVRDLIEKLRRRFPQAAIVAGGEHITALPEFSLQDCPGLDYCVLGEGEEALVEFVEAFRAERSLEDVAGLCYRKGVDTARTRARERIKDVAAIPWPAWGRLPIEAYLASGYGNGVNKGRNMPILATRGCPYQCTFCSNPTMYSQRYFMRPAEDVIREMRHYADAYKADFIEFYDLTAIIRKDWIMEFCRLYLDSGLSVGWSLPSGTRSEALDEEVLQMLYKTNCRYLVYAPESGSSATLKEIKKQVNLERLEKSVLAAVKLGINTRCNLIIGFPKETLRDVLETLKFQLRLAFIGVDDAPIYMFSPYPGSALFEYLRRTGQIKELDEEYFDRLLAQMDLGVSQTYCESLGGKFLRACRILGMSLFYALSYLLRPGRILRSISNIFITRMTDTVFEQRLLEMSKRHAHA